MLDMWDVGFLDIGYVGCGRCKMLGMWHVGEWDFQMWDVWDMGCSGCGMLGMWDVLDVR